MSQSLHGKVAVITGASSGIGWAMAKAFVAAGCKVGLMARRGEQLQSLASEITAAGGVAVPAVADVGDRGQVENAVAAIRSQLGPIDLMIANAGLGMITTLDPVNIADVEAMFRVNTLGVIYSFAAVMPEMLARKSGHLVGVSSIAGFRGLPGESAYCASKAAVNVYLDGLRIHLRGTGVKVTTVCPGFIKTPMTAKTDPKHMPWLMEPDDAARRIVRAVRAGRKLFEFPRRLALLVKLSRWAPDGMMKRVMGDYNAEAAQLLADQQTK